MNRTRTPILIVLFALALHVPVVSAQDYKIQRGDILSVKFWQDPSLNTEARVGQDGNIELPVIGSVRAAGMTPSELSQRIVDGISRYRINITQALVKVVEYTGNTIYVTGQVGTPGSYSFEAIPSLWNVLQKAGGVLQTADLERVTVIRAGKNANVVIPVDVTQFLQNGDKLPTLKGGDTIHVPALESGRAGSTPSSPFVSTDEIYIAGEVANPGRYSFASDLSLMDVLVMAGGPTPAAELSSVRIIKRKRHADPAVKAAIMKVDLETYLDTSEPGPLSLHPGDTIYVPRREQQRGGALSFIAGRILVPVVSAVAVALIVNTVR